MPQLFGHSGNIRLLLIYFEILAIWMISDSHANLNRDGVLWAVAAKRAAPGGKMGNGSNVLLLR